MVNLDTLRLDMTKKLEVDSKIHTVEVRGDTLDECLQDAAVQLETKVSNLEYEVQEKGYGGFLGLMKKPWFVKVYENPDIIKEKQKSNEEAMFDDEELAQKNLPVKKDGYFYIHHFGSGIFLKVVLPENGGQKVDDKDVLSNARRTDNISLDENLIKELSKKGTENKYVEIGSYNHNAACDAILALDVSNDEMQATINVSSPGPGGAEISENQIISALETQRVVAGIEYDKISAFIDNPVYNVPYEVAAAILPVDGRDAYIAYNFETDNTKLKLKETKNGQIDFKELNLIQNVVAGQPLAQKMLPQRGKGGKTITGRYLEAKNGKDINIPLGQNVKLDRDGCTVLAEKNGHVMLVGNKITVEEVYEVSGVNIKSGNITYMGTVIVHGNVEDGFSVKADGNIEVYGSVGNCKLQAEGDIVISQGVMGRDEGEIISSKSVWARFIQNAKVTAGEYVVVNDNIMNSEVTAMKKILLKGKRAAIIGGHLFATEQVSAKNIGSANGGTETIIEVGIDPNAKMRLLELQKMIATCEKDLEEIDLNIQTIEKSKEVRRTIPKEKEESLNKFKSQKESIEANIDEMQKEFDDKQKRLRELRVVGRVMASGSVYPGTKITVRDVSYDVIQELKSVCFYYENGFVRSGKYDQSQDKDDVEGPSGYTKS